MKSTTRRVQPWLLLLPLAWLIALGGNASSPGDEPQPQQASAADEDAEKIDFDKARHLLRKQNDGNQLTPEEEKYLQRARAAFRQKNAAAGNANNRDSGKPSVGLTPLTEMTAEDRYKGQDGGLYGGGRNAPPESHLQAALREAAKIVPLDADGKPSADGRIVMISNGMSNTTQQFGRFIRLANADAQKAPRVKLVDCAQGGQEALDWAQPEERHRKDRGNPWDVMSERLARAKVTPLQVQVAWILQARRNPKSLGEFPAHADEFRGHMAVLVNKLKQRFPNLRLVYLSSRIYAGYASTQLNPEPYAYEYAFALRSLIQSQIEGAPSLNYDPDRGDVRAPLLLWGPYLWADGVNGRKTDDLVWNRQDFAGDGTHPSPSGRQKTAKLLLRFMKSDPAARVWFVETGSVARWSGTWQADGSEDCKELKCDARHVRGADWEATFAGVCNRSFSFEVAMQGRETDGKIVFTGETDLGADNGGVYRWSGQIVGGSFTGKYESAGGKNGTFSMMPHSPDNEDTSAKAKENQP